MKPILTLLLLYSLALTGQAQSDAYRRFQKALIMAGDGDVITLDEGTFHFTGSLSLDAKKRVTIRGKGQQKTILNFRGQTEGAEGIRVDNSENIVIEDLTVQDTKGDCIKTMNVNGITFRNVTVEWTGIPGPDNGSYGLYPVQCQNVLIENCTAMGASDAGIYVGQSRNIIVRKCRATHNVAGIEIENSQMADVYDNDTYDNTGGILVFDLPDLVQKKGGNVRVFNNRIYNNNYKNFAPKGNIVAKVPAGTGVMVLATSQVEIFGNEIRKNNSVGTSIVSYYMTENPIKDSSYYPYPTAISVHDNVYERDPVRFQGKGRIGQLFRLKLRFGKRVPDIVYDGIVDPAVRGADGQIRSDARICIRNNQNATFVNLDAGNNFRGLSREVDPYDCTHTPLQETVVRREP